jgi:hypothetical protein
MVCGDPRCLRRAVAVRAGLHDYSRPSPAQGVAMPREGAMIFGRWLLAAAMFALPSYTLAQEVACRAVVEISAIAKLAPARVLLHPFPHSPCWRSTVVRGQTIIWNCQPYPPPRP